MLATPMVKVFWWLADVRWDWGGWWITDYQGHRTRLLVAFVRVEAGNGPEMFNTLYLGPLAIRAGWIGI